MSRGKSLLVIIWIVAAAALLNRPAHAHRSWEDGQDTETWVQQQCCGLADAHWFWPEEVRETEVCYIVEDFPVNNHCIPKDPPECRFYLEASADWLRYGCRDRINQHGARYWFFWTDNPKGSERDMNPTIYCVFYPVGT